MSTFSPTLAPTVAPTSLSIGANIGIELAYFVILSAFCCCSGLATWLFARIFTSSEPEDRRRALAIMNMADNIGFRNMLLTDEHLNRIGDFEFGDDSKPHSENGDEHTECSICLSEFKTGEACRTMPAPCRHAFHKSCIDEWFHQSSRCPMCKRSIFNILEEENQNPEHTNEVHPHQEMMTRL